MVRRESSRRGGLFATSSLAASLAISAGVMGLFAFAPAAMAANECGDPVTNGVAADSFTCAPGTYATGIVYPLTAGALTLNLQDSPTGSVNTTTGGVQVTGLPGDSVSITRSTTGTPAPFADPTIINTAGAGVGVTSPDSNLTVGERHRHHRLDHGDQRDYRRSRQCLGHPDQRRGHRSGRRRHRRRLDRGFGHRRHGRGDHLGDQQRSPRLGDRRRGGQPDRLHARLRRGRRLRHRNRRDRRHRDLRRGHRRQRGGRWPDRRQ